MKQTLELAPGTSLAGYRIEALLGRGGMGLVYTRSSSPSTAPSPSS